MTGPPSEFEQQVAEALIKVMVDAQAAGAKSLWADSTAAHLVPRVAAAIARADEKRLQLARDFANCECSDCVDLVQQAALAALRGRPV